MPAIQPARLKHQIVELSQAYRQPEKFIQRLHDILGLYTDRTHKPGQSGEPKPLIEAYNVPPPVLRQVLTELRPFAQVYPEDTLILCDILWQQPYWEFQYLATCILGQFAGVEDAQVIRRLRSWLSDDIRDQMIDLVLENATYQLRSKNIEALLEWTKDLLASDQKFYRDIAIRMITILAREGYIGDYPALFTQIDPLLRNIPPGLKPNVISLVSELAKHSPGETAYTLRKNLTVEDSPDTAWLIRQVLKSFPDSYQEGLRTAMRTKDKNRL